MSAAPAFAEGCQTSCEAECLKVAPGSGDYCTSACSDECSALKADNGGEEVEAVRLLRGVFHTNYAYMHDVVHECFFCFVFFWNRDHVFLSLSPPFRLWGLGFPSRHVAPRVSLGCHSFIPPGNRASSLASLPLLVKIDWNGQRAFFLRIFPFFI